MVGGDADVELPQRSTGRSSDLVYRLSAVPRAGAPAPGRHDPEIPGPAPGRLRRLDRPRIRHTHRGRPLRQADRPDHRGLIRHDRQVIPAWPATSRDILSSAQRAEWSFDRCRKTPAPHPPGAEKCSTSSCPAEFECDLIRERRHAGLEEAAWARGRTGSRPPLLSGAARPRGKPAPTAQRGQTAHPAGTSASRSVTTPDPLRLRVRSRYIYRRDIPSSAATASAVLTPTFSCSANLAITCSCARACAHSASDIFSLVHMTTDRMVFRSRRHIPGHRGPSVPTPSDSDSNSKTALLGYTLSERFLPEERIAP